MAHRTSSLLLNVKDLLQVETQRVEFKRQWHSKNASGPRGTYWQVVHTICAFANDFYNDNGGYIVIGVEERENWEDTTDHRQIILPPFGVPPKDLDDIEKEIKGACLANINPEYRPILSREVVEVDGVRKVLLVIWATASDNRPHTCRETEKKKNESDIHHYYIREAAETRKASPNEERTLLSLHSKIPFDDRRASNPADHSQHLSEEDIDSTLFKTFLEGIGKQLQEHEDENPVCAYQRWNLLVRVSDKKEGVKLVPVFAPKNVALLFFHQNPHEFFAGAKTEIAIYTHDNEVQKEKVITGPIDHQIENIVSSILETTKEEARHEFVAYPTRALREAVVNAFHHRSYEACDNNPIKIHIKPDCIEVISYPGPDPSLKLEDFSGEKNVPPVPSRNRRIAEFLKDGKLAEGRFTGVKTIYSTMKKNNNPKPSFDFNSSFFCVSLPGHPKYIAYSILRDVDNHCAVGDKNEAIKSLKGFLDEHLKDEETFWGTEMLISKLLELHDNHTNHPNVQPYKRFITDKLARRIPLITELCKWCVSEEPGDNSTGEKIVKRLVAEGARYDDLNSVVRKAVDLYTERRADHERALLAVQNAHKLFEAMGEITQTIGYLAYHFACCKFKLYMMTTRSRTKRQSRVGLLKEAEDCVNRAIQLTNEDYKHHLANHYRQLGYIHSQLLIIQKSTKQKVIAFYKKARKYNPGIQFMQVFVPEEYRDQFGPTGSPWSDLRLSIMNIQ